VTITSSAARDDRMFIEKEAFPSGRPSPGC